MITSGTIEINDSLIEPSNKIWENHMYSTSFMRSSEDIYNFTVPSLSLMQFLIPKKETNNYLRGCTILNSSSLLYEKSREYLNNDILVFPNIINEISKDISNLELKISSELKFLSEQEAKWTSLSDFAEEYKKELEISDEELWYEFGHELNTIAYEIHSINQTKQLIFASKDFLKRAKKIICSLLTGIKFNHRCEFRQQIAFSTKNLDDEHNSEVKIFDKSSFTKSDFVFNEKKDNNQTVTFSLQGGSSKRTKRCSASSN